MVYKIVRYIGCVLSFLFFPIRIKGENILNKKGSLILAANHVSYMDPVVLGIATKRQIHFMAKKEIFKVPILGFIIRCLGAIPIDREKATPESIKRAFSILRDGRVLGIFPEGTRSLNGEILELNAGLIKIALKTSAPIIPIGINGTFEIYPSNSKYPKIHKRKKIYINFGKPIYLDSKRMKDIKYQEQCLAFIKNNIRELTSTANK